MEEAQTELLKWFEKLSNLPPEAHLLCPKVSNEDEEDYTDLHDPHSQLSGEQKKQRIEDGQERLDITYWNTLVFGFDKRDSGQWLDDFTSRLNGCLRDCADCVLNWHMQRKTHLRKFAERWDEEAEQGISRFLDDLDVKRITASIQWAKQEIEAARAKGQTFKRSNFGDKLGEVHIAIYEALCCMSYLAEPKNREEFQIVFLTLQGKSFLKLGSSVPLPGMAFFLFDPVNEQRRNWAKYNWQTVIDRPEDSPMTEEQFDWAVSGALTKYINDLGPKEPMQATAEDCLQFEQFWQAVTLILQAMSDSLILSRLRHLGTVSSFFDMLFSHTSRCRSEGVLVAVIRVLTTLFRRSPKAIWDIVGDAKPNVVADMVFGSPVYRSLLSQSLEDCWNDDDLGNEHTPFPTIWIAPWLQSLPRDRRYDACDTLMHTLFAGLALNQEVGEPGRAACIKAGLDALKFTMQSFVDSGSAIGTGTTHFFANATFDLVSNHRSLIMNSLRPPPGSDRGWSRFRVADAAIGAMEAGMKLDMKLFAEEYIVLNNKDPKSSVSNDRKSKDFWESVVDMYERISDTVDLASRFLLSLEPIVAVEHVRPLKKSQLTEHALRFNKALSDTIDVLTRIMTRVSELDDADLNILLTERKGIKVVVALSLQGESDFAEASCAVLKTWTGELSRSAAFEHMSRLHPYESLSALTWSTGRILQPPDPWGPIRPLQKMSLDILRGLTDASDGVLRKETPMDGQLTATLLRWWASQWFFVSLACRHIEGWSQYISNNIMTDFCREIMELAEALIAEDGLITSAVVRCNGQSEQKAMQSILQPAKENFRGMENMIRLKDYYLVDLTVKVLCKILTRLRENSLEINHTSRKLITDACVRVGKGYPRHTNLNDNQRAELLRALGYEEDTEVVEIDQMDFKGHKIGKDKARKQTSIEAWSKSGSSTAGSLQSSLPTRTNRDDVRELSKSLDNPVLRQLEAKRAKAAPLVPDPKAISTLKANREREKAEKKKRDQEAIAKMKGTLVPGEGSGLRGLGVLGKDHGRSEIMINSSDEDSDSDADSDDDGQLAALSSGGKQIDEAARRRQKALLDKTRQPVKKTRRVHSAKEMRARLIPPMDRLHNIILAWDIFHQGDQPPSGPKGNQVATRYPNPKNYQDTFLPLLASEAWRGFVTAKSETTSRPFEMPVASRATVDSYLEVTFNIPVVQHRDRGIREGDIILVSDAPQPLSSPQAKSCLARIQKTRYKGATVEISYRINPRNNAIASELTPKTTTYGVKITNMNTIEREYAALESLQYYDLMEEILRAEPSPILKYSAERISNYSNNWQLNRAQAEAVLGAQDNDGFTLIQGPPGTGKTKTITAMVGALLSEQLNQAANAGTPMGLPTRPVTAASQASGQSRPKKLLVCAPSNAAVDELVLRLKGGVKTIGGKARKINVLRLGRVEAINAAVKDVSLDEQVRLRLEGDSTKEKAKEAQDKLHEEAGNLKHQLAELRALMEQKKENEDRTEYLKLSGQFDTMKKRQMEIGRQIDANKDTANSMGREAEIRRKRIQQEILNSAHVLCATLSGSGHEMFRSLDVEFETVIIDEAAQSVELTALIPLKYGCCKCILVGDPKQLPPTVLSQSAAQFGYDQSLFVRMQQNHPNSVHLLDTQYRMHPEISLLPSKEFYEGQLKDGPSMIRDRMRPWHRSEMLGPYRFFDVEGVQQKGHKGSSLVNVKELEVAAQIYESFRRNFKESDTERKIGIITPYKAQLEALRRRFEDSYGEDITSHIDFNTTDAFQGRECEIIIFSCVRASATGGIGFMKDIRRMNVGLTRAKSSLWILGDARALSQGEYWNKLIVDAKARNRFTSGDILNMFRKPLKLIEGDLVPPVSEQKLPSNEDVAMPDAPKLALPHNMKAVEQRAVTAQSSQVENNETSLKTNLATTAQKDVPRNDTRPVIHTKDEPRDHDSRKRAPDGDAAGQPTVKRIAPDRPRASLMNKFGGGAKKQAMKPPNKAPAPKDPAALSSLGLEPPERPAAIHNGSNAATRTPSGYGAASTGTKIDNAALRQGSSKTGEKPPARPNGQPGGPPVPRKKPKPSLFINKRR